MLPLEPEQLAATEPEVERDDVESVEPLGLRRLEDLLRVPDRETSADGVLGSRDLDELGHVAGHQLVAHRVLEAGSQHGVGELHPAPLHPGRREMLAHQADVPDRQRPQFLGADARDDVEPDDELVALVGLRRPVRFDDRFEPVLEVALDGSSPRPKPGHRRRPPSGGRSASGGLRRGCSPKPGARAAPATPDGSTKGQAVCCSGPEPTTFFVCRGSLPGPASATPTHRAPHGRHDDVALARAWRTSSRTASCSAADNGGVGSVASPGVEGGLISTSVAATRLGALTQQQTSCPNRCDRPPAPLPR